MKKLISLAAGVAMLALATGATKVDTVKVHIAVAQAFSQGLAAGGFLFDAASISHVDTAASF